MASDAEFPSALGIALEMRGVEGESEQCGGISADPEGYPREIDWIAEEFLELHEEKQMLLVEKSMIDQVWSGFDRSLRSN